MWLAVVDACLLELPLVADLLYFPSKQTLVNLLFSSQTTAVNRPSTQTWSTIVEDVDSGESVDCRPLSLHHRSALNHGTEISYSRDISIPFCMSWLVFKPPADCLPARITSRSLKSFIP